MRAALALSALLAGCAVCEPRIVDLRPAVEDCLKDGMLPGAVKVDGEGKLLAALCVEVRLKRREGPAGSDS